MKVKQFYRDKNYNSKPQAAKNSSGSSSCLLTYVSKLAAGEDLRHFFERDFLNVSIDSFTDFSALTMGKRSASRRARSSAAEAEAEDEAEDEDEETGEEAEEVEEAEDEDETGEEEDEVEEAEEATGLLISVLDSASAAATAATSLAVGAETRPRLRPRRSARAKASEATRASSNAFSIIPFIMGPRIPAASLVRLLRASREV